MPTQDEIRVLNLLSAVDYAPGTDPGKLIESWGNGAVTVACEAALGTYPGLRPKVRTNAVVRDLDTLLQSPSLPPLVAVEVVKTLINIGSNQAKRALQTYKDASPNQLPHRANALIASYLEKAQL